MPRTPVRFDFLEEIPQGERKSNPQRKAARKKAIASVNTVLEKYQGLVNELVSETERAIHKQDRDPPKAEYHKLKKGANAVLNVERQLGTLRKLHAQASEALGAAATVVAHQLGIKAKKKPMAFSKKAARKKKKKQQAVKAKRAKTPARASKRKKQVRKAQKAIEDKDSTDEEDQPSKKTPKSKGAAATAKIRARMKELSRRTSVRRRVDAVTGR